MAKRALITGITGQDGRYMAQLLVEQGYDVFGMVRGQANPKIRMIQEETPKLELVEGDLQDLSSLIAAVEQVLGHSIEMTCAGRTDAGVHAWGQVVACRNGSGNGRLSTVYRYERPVAECRASTSASTSVASRTTIVGPQS